MLSRGRKKGDSGALPAKRDEGTRQPLLEGVGYLQAGMR
jgi:hypothetical protein